MSTKTLNEELKNLADDGNLRLDAAGHFELKAHNEDTFTPITFDQLLESIQDLPEDLEVGELEREIRAHLGA